MKVTLVISSEADPALFEYVKDDNGTIVDYVYPYEYALVGELEIVDLITPGTFGIPTGSIYCETEALTQEDFETLESIEWVDYVYVEDV